MTSAAKVISRSVSLSQDLWERLDRIAVEKYTGNRTAYLRKLIESDLNGISVGTPQSAFTVEDVRAGQRAEAALLRAEIIARDYLFAEERARPAVARQLCEHLLTATRRGTAAAPAVIQPTLHDISQMVAQAEHVLTTLPAPKPAQRKK